MPLTPAQKTTLKAHLAANTNVVVIGGTNFQIKDIGVDDRSQEAADKVVAWYNLPFSPDYWVWNEATKESDIYDLTSDLAAPTDWSYATYKAQSVSEQGAWGKVVMGGTANFTRRNTRAAVHAIFGGSVPGNLQRDHILAMGRKKAKTSEKILAVAVVNPPANSGNTSGDARGAKTNPDELGLNAAGLPITSLTTQDIFDAWSA